MLDYSYYLNAWTELLARFIVLFSAITVHEYAHGYVSYKLGDPTAKYAGRLSLNPLKHLDPVGAICMVLFKFGWAKPVPINPMYYQDRKKGTAITSLAGPVANIILALLSTILFAPYLVFVESHLWSWLGGFIDTVFYQLAVVNISFAIFNLLPIPPLDGSKILGCVLSGENYMKLLRYERFGFPILIVLTISGILGKILNFFIAPIYSVWSALLSGLINILG